MDARKVDAFKGHVNFFVIVIASLHVISVDSQEGNNLYGEGYYNREGIWVPPGTAEHQTYVYKDRRYGPSYLDPVYRSPSRAPEDRIRYGVSSITFNKLY